MGKKSENKHILISGGAKGLGYSLAVSLLESDYSVSTFSRRKTDSINGLSKKYPDKLFFDEVDITDSDRLKAFVKIAIEKNGPIYGLINNAAFVQDGILATLPEVEISKMISTNLEGTIRLTRLCISRMLMSSQGRIINISSIIGTRGYNGLSVYSATKAGIDGFTRSVAREVGRKNITVNSVAPGYMKTDMSASLEGGRLEQIVRRTPMRRLATTDDVLPLIHFLLSDGACFVTGQTILVDGGISC